MTICKCDELAESIIRDRFPAISGPGEAITMGREDLVRLLTCTANESRSHASVATSQAVSLLSCFDRLEDEFMDLLRTDHEPGRALCDATELVKVAAGILVSIDY